MSALACLVLPALALAQPVPPRSFFSLSSSNGHGAVMVDARGAKVVHFREHLPATEEPQLDVMGREVWVGNQPQMVKTRDVLFDAYFGLRASGQQRWLTQAPTSSGYVTAAPSPRSGSGLVTWEQPGVLGLDTSTFVFAPRGLPHASFVMALRVRNPGSQAVPGVSVFSLHNFHLGFGRPGVMQELGVTGETVVVKANRDVEERAFAGVVVARPLGATPRVAAWNQTSPAQDNGFQVVAQTTGDLPNRTGDLGVGDDWASAFQFDVGDVPAGAERWVAVVVAHHGDPFATATVQAWLDAYVMGQTARQLVEAERTAWATFQQGLRVPAGLSMDEEAVLRQSAVVLDMAQVRDREAFVRDVLTRDGELRRSRFPTVDGGALPGLVRHRGYGAVLASLPPGEWTYSWIRDGAYAVAAMATLGLTEQSRDALRFYLDAEGGRFKDWNELAPYNLPPYVISLTRYVGFGVEETDFNDFGPNLEFDGFGLFLWALRRHEVETQDTTLTDTRWNDIATKVADPLVALVDPATGLIRKDSSIWETHWNGRERAWTYTSLTAARGLCDAAAIAQRKGDLMRATRYRDAGLALRRAIAQRLTDGTGALASNLEELQSGREYFDAAVFDALAMGLFDPSGRIGRATTMGLDRLRVTAGPGWSRNDDRRDHQGRMDLSPWGSEYDSAEWVITDVRGSMVHRAQGQTARADALLRWIGGHAVANADLIPETFDETSGAWKFNAPMVGFGAGVWVLALAHRSGAPLEPACGAFFDESAMVDGGAMPTDAGQGGGTAGGGAAGGSAGGSPLAGGAAAVDAGPGAAKPPPGCGCDGSGAGSVFWLALLGVAGRSARRHLRADG
ncbi:MAG: glycosyl hydrolase [Myxococcaceae bacterium]|nr:glycosyl hydrolase [Myxococcaceae bacterium]